jgi:hypothetical protein
VVNTFEAYKNVPRQRNKNKARANYCGRSYPNK